MSSYLTLDVWWLRCGKIQSWRAWRMCFRIPEIWHDDDDIDDDDTDDDATDIDIDDDEREIWR